MEVRWAYLRGIDATLLERAAGRVVGTQVAVLAPVTAEGAIHAGKAAAREEMQAVRHTVSGTRPGSSNGPRRLLHRAL